MWKNLASNRVSEALHLKADGLWMNADFGFYYNNDLHQRIVHQILIQFLYGFFYLTFKFSPTTLVCVQTLACKCGFKVVETFEHAFYRQVQKYTEEISL
jgi:hypothetical protein